MSPRAFRLVLPPLWLILSVVTPIVATLAIIRSVSLDYLRANAVGIVFFFALYTVGELLYVPLPKGGGVSVGLGIILACAAIYGPGVAALVAGLAMLTAMSIVSREASFSRYASNFGQIAISAFVAGWVFELLGGQISEGSLGRNAAALVASSAGFFVANVALVMAFLSSFNRQPLKTYWPDVKYNLASYFALVPLGILVALIFDNYGIPGSLLFFVPLLLARYSFLQYLHTRKASLTVTQALAAALEAKDAYTRGHSDRVAAYAVEVARELNLSEEDIETLRYAAEMHDIGKIGIRETLLNKPGSLTEAELAEIREHAVIGADMVKKIEFLKGVSEIIKYHHEWFDGSNGYPRELVGERIPQGARILMVCDSFDAMTSDRPYRSSLGRREAIQRLNDGAGRQFDPRVVDAFLRILRREQTID